MTIVTPFFAAVLALIYLALSVNVVRYRFGNKISLGSDGNKHLEYAVRAHGNFIEYVPFTLLLMWFVESLTLSGHLVFWLGSILVAARVAHAFGMFYPRQLLFLRQFGMVATIAVMLKACIAIFTHYLPLSI